MHEFMVVEGVFLCYNTDKIRALRRTKWSHLIGNMFSTKIIVFPLHTGVGSGQSVRMDLLFYLSNFSHNSILLKANANQPTDTAECGEAERRGIGSTGFALLALNIIQLL